MKKKKQRKQLEKHIPIHTRERRSGIAVWSDVKPYIHEHIYIDTQQNIY